MSDTIEENNKLEKVRRENTRLQTELAKLATKPALLELAIDRVPNYWLIIDEHFTIHAVRKQFCELIKSHKKSVLEHSFFDLLDHYDAEVWAEKLAESRSGQAVKILLQLRDKDKNVQQLEMVIHHLQIGSQFFYALSGNDDNQLNHDFERLKQESNLLASLMDNMPDAIYFKDRDSRFIKINMHKLNKHMQQSKFISGFGDIHSEEDVRGKTDFDVFTNEHAKQAFEDEQRIMQTGKPMISMVEKETWPDGSETWVSTTKVPIYDDGNIIGIIGISRDVTEQKQRELELRRLRDEAVQASKAKSNFLANMSHEIRTPMNAIVGMTNLLLDTKLNDEQFDFVETIRSSGETLIYLINDILDFSKIESGKLELEKQPLLVLDCIEDVVDLFKGIAVEKDIELLVDIELDVPDAIVGDITRLRQILVNLIGNGLKFTESGEIIIRVSCRNNDGKQCTLHFAVQDTGIGISMKNQKRLFTSFSQVDSSTTRKYGGTGLGLAISKKLVELMGGEMGVESEVGQGSTFYFTIQTKTANLKNPTAAKRSLTVPEKPVFIVDDNPTNLRLLSKQLFNWGIPSESFAVPEIALDTFKANPNKYSLGILDFNMPKMDGIRLAKEIRKIKSKQDVPLVLFGSVVQENMRLVNQYFNQNLMKPVKKSLLFNCLLRFFEGEFEANARKKRRDVINKNLAAEFPLRILLAEDNPTNQRVAAHQLSRMGYRTDVVANGEEVLSAVKKVDYDVILMDVQMPELDGMEATKILIDRYQRPERPQIIAMTANAMQGDRDECLAIGMDDYISKPVRMDDLVNALKNAYLKRKAMQ